MIMMIMMIMMMMMHEVQPSKMKKWTYSYHISHRLS